MPDKTRAELLEEFVRAKPDDAFSRYGLAMELRKLGRNDEACNHFRTLMDKNESYVATYLMFGQLLTTLGRTDEAKEVFSKGVAVATKVGNGHAADELSEALGQLS